MLKELDIVETFTPVDSHIVSGNYCLNDFGLLEFATSIVGILILLYTQFCYDFQILMQYSQIKSLFSNVEIDNYQLQA